LAAVLFPARAPAQTPAASEPLSPQEIFESFARRMDAGERKDFPWEVTVSRPYLGLLQRLFVDFRVRLRVRDLERRNLMDELQVTAWLGDRSGRWLPDAGTTFQTARDEILPGMSEFSIDFAAALLPGDYTAGIVLCDRTGTLCNVARRRLRVRPLQRDPLPELWRDLPPVQFLDSTVNLDLWVRPELKGRLWLPVETRQPVEVELLVNFSTSERQAGRYATHYLTLGEMAVALKVLAEMRLSSGALHVTAVDTMRQTILFEQRDLRQLDWPRLRQALLEIHPKMIDLKQLEERRQNAAFFRDVLADRLNPPRSPATTASPPAASPKRVLIILTPAILFSRGTDLKPLRWEGGGERRAYYLSFQTWGMDNWDELRKVLSALKPRRFLIGGAQDFRKALATIVTELGQP
jgi:hypothetical protein